MSEGKVRPNKLGQYFVNSQSGGANSNEPRIKFVTPMAQAVELAKSELKEEETGVPGSNVANKRTHSKKRANKSKGSTKKKATKRKAPSKQPVNNKKRKVDIFK